MWRDGLVSWTMASRSPSRDGSGRSSIARVRLKIAAFTPRPSASVAIAVIVTPGRDASARMVLMTVGGALDPRAVEVRFEHRRDEAVRGRVDADFAPEADDGAAEPRQLQPPPALEILQHRGLRFRRHGRVGLLDVLDD